MINVEEGESPGLFHFDDVNIGDITHFFLVARVGHPILTSAAPLTDIFDYKIGLVNSN
ncbi:protein of unknown function, might belong to Transcriptional regulator, LysR family protein [Shewanella benthica]|uniref:Uncharacterized protein n=1 Tax=Shewanella benthica TaxID=43661 RepID=A0A330MAP3_9GAMM|nr:protein of unknown function, might belong to Transcriptional regulator, LysR family protein [Shewanella benthica]